MRRGITSGDALFREGGHTGGSVPEINLLESECHGSQRYDPAAVPQHRRPERNGPSGFPLGNPQTTDRRHQPAERRHTATRSDKNDKIETRQTGHQRDVLPHERLKLAEDDNRKAIHINKLRRSATTQQQVKVISMHGSVPGHRTEKARKPRHPATQGDIGNAVVILGEHIPSAQKFAGAGFGINSRRRSG